ncbi:MAG: UbiX family flavin prenyltransferase [Acidobacteria bacterium]|nr:UbiX family flavin prenyltransferase [Acidobacteriota bacterium]
MSTAPSAPLVVAITGATGIVYGVRLLERLREAGVGSHLVMSKWAIQTMLQETDYTVDGVKRLATEVHSPDDFGAAISSGSFVTRGMVVAPCSMRTLAAISTGNGTTLVHRAADVVLKERRRLVLVPREAPLSDIHLEHMLRLSRMGTVIFPPVPAFYQRPVTVADIVDHTVMRVLDQFGLHADSAGRWTGKTATPLAARG